MEKKLNKALDAIDIKILNELQRNGKISNIDLSKKVGLSPTPCLERVKRLEKQGVIMGYRALLNPELLEAPLLVIVEILTYLRNLMLRFKSWTKFKNAI